jgi:hypothetical protein
MLIILALSSSILFAGAGPGPGAGRVIQTVDCDNWQDCRDRALAAAAGGDFERFHDLSWRTVQKGPKNDPALLTMLARAQSLSGRPHDALVMLQRLDAMGVATDAAESEDFRRVRALPAWKEWQARMAGAASAPAAGTEAPATPPAKPEPAGAVTAPTKPADSEKPASGDAAGTTDAVRFTTLPFTPVGLAYDAVSNRFIVGDRLEQKLTVIGERSQRPVNLTGAESGGFGRIEAITIDVREGDLWVASTPEGEPGTLHKLQLISGRLLTAVALPGDASGARLTDIGISPQGDVLALDSSGRRLFKLTPGSKAVALVSRLDTAGPVSIAPAPGNVVYVAGSEGLSRLEGADARVIKAAGKIDLSGLVWIRWHHGRLIGIQRSNGDLHRIVRIRLDAGGRRATRLEVLEDRVAMASPSSAALTGEALYYLARDTRYSASEGMDLIIRRITLASNR